MRTGAGYSDWCRLVQTGACYSGWCRFVHDSSDWDRLFRLVQAGLAIAAGAGWCRLMPACADWSGHSGGCRLVQAGVG